ncbi:hypothetical protein PMAYCL1PPCAC_25960, partial [Pristionchus mayeri]
YIYMKRVDSSLPYGAVPLIFGYLITFVPPDSVCSILYGAFGSRPMDAGSYHGLVAYYRIQAADDFAFWISGIFSIFYLVYLNKNTDKASDNSATNEIQIEDV